MSLNDTLAKATLDTSTSKAIHICRELVFGSKWILVPFYLGLVIAQVIYAIHYVRETYEMVHTFWGMDSSQLMLAVLALIDVTMIANLVRTIIAGSYHAFIDKDGPVNEHISSGYLKVKMGMSLVGVSSIHLLQTFINASHATDRELIIRGSLHIVFLFSTIGLALVEYLHEKSKHIHD